MTTSDEEFQRIRTNLRVATKFANRSFIDGAGDRGAVGRRLLEDALKYAALLEEVESVIPLLESVVYAFSDNPKSGDYYYDFSSDFGLFIALNVLSPEDALREGRLFSRAVGNFFNYLDQSMSSASFADTGDSSPAAVQGVALLSLARAWGIEVRGSVARLSRLKVRKSHLPLFRRLAGCLRGERWCEIDREYCASMSRAHYHAATVNGLLLGECYTVSLVRAKGDFRKALTQLLC